jgi:hypothetical protein
MGFLLNSKRKYTGLRLQKHPLLLFFSKNQDALPRIVKKAGGNRGKRGAQRIEDSASWTFQQRRTTTFPHSKERAYKQTKRQVLKIEPRYSKRACNTMARTNFKGW